MVYAFESSVSNLNNFHFENWKAIVIDISLYTIHCLLISFVSALRIGEEAKFVTKTVDSLPSENFTVAKLGFAFISCTMSTKG